MAPTSILGFVRGADLSGNALGDNSPERMREMGNLFWLKLNKTGLTKLPDDVVALSRLEQLSAANNAIEEIDASIGKLSRLQVFSARKNKLTTETIAPELFSIEELTTLDFTANKLVELPAEIAEARHLQILSVGHNSLTQLPGQLFVNCTEIRLLDLSHNNIESIPPQLRRLTRLETLLLGSNPLGPSNLRSVFALTALQELDLSNTQRTVHNILPEIEQLVNLQTLDLSRNELTDVPDAILNLSRLRRLNLAENRLTRVPHGVGQLSALESLVVSRNAVVDVTPMLAECTRLRRLILNDNHIETIPDVFAQLTSLETVVLKRNRLKTIPASLCACASLRRLVLANNELETLPPEVYQLTKLTEFDIAGNARLAMPEHPKKVGAGDGEGLNVDFADAEARGKQLAALRGHASRDDEGDEGERKGPRKQLVKTRSLKLHDGEAPPEASDKVLQGLKDVAEKGREAAAELGGEAIKTRRKWDQMLERPDMDYGELFGDDAGTTAGLSVWRIENFLPTLVEAEMHGRFYQGDAYVVLSTTGGGGEEGTSGGLRWAIHFWIGNDSTLDKKASAAIHAVNLRNFLGSQSMAVREEQGDESDEFLALFGHDIQYIAGGTESGFFETEKTAHTNRLYWITGERNVRIELVQLSGMSLDSTGVFVLVAEKKIYVWCGTRSRALLRSKGRLMAEKINRTERNNRCETLEVGEGTEPASFWEAVGGRPAGSIPSVPTHQPGLTCRLCVSPILYRATLGRGFLELPQVDLPGGRMQQGSLDSSGVYILDCGSELFVWVGRKSSRIVRAAAVRLSEDMVTLIPRPKYASIARVVELAEPAVFKARFEGWDDVVPVDFSSEAKKPIVLTVRQKMDRVNPAELLAKAEAEKATKKMDIDISAVFTTPRPPLPDAEADAVFAAGKDRLEKMECFVLEGKKFVRLPKTEYGHFYRGDCYVFLCTYWKEAEAPPPAEENGGEEEEEPEDEIECVVYFWEGSASGKMGWLTFTFGFEREIEALVRSNFGCELRVVRLGQQRETNDFLSHFDRKIVIHSGRRPTKKAPQPSTSEKGEKGAKDKKAPAAPVEKMPIELFQVHRGADKLCTRTIQVEAKPSSLCSTDCFVLRVPFDNSKSGIVYVWIGSQAPKDIVPIVEHVALQLKDSGFSMQTIAEGFEPENFFWVALGGRSAYDKRTSPRPSLPRLFKATNDNGVFTVRDVGVRFCQHDLFDGDVAILDDGDGRTFVWAGPLALEVERKLAVRSARIYSRHVGRDADACVTIVNKWSEPLEFTRCFHGWVPFPPPEKKEVRGAFTKEQLAALQHAHEHRA